MSMADTMKAYGVTKKDTTHYKKDYLFSIKGYELFGEETSEIRFNYVPFNGNSNFPRSMYTTLTAQTWILY